tara:strand:+ start:1276 stop:1620 length:345 start_codon:yes stop_codon:yes gene_type:complete
MIKYLRIVDKALRTFFDDLGVPNLAQMDKAVNKAEDKLWKGVAEYKVKDERSLIIPYLLLLGFAVVTIGSTASLYALSIPEVAKDGLRLTTLISLVGIVGVALHLGLNKLTGED